MPASPQQCKDLVNALNAYIDAYAESGPTGDAQTHHQIQHDAAKESSHHELVTIPTGSSHIAHWQQVLKKFGIAGEAKRSDETLAQETIDYVPPDSVFFRLSQNFEIKGNDGNILSTTSIEAATQNILSATSKLQISAAQKIFLEFQGRLHQLFPKNPEPSDDVKQEVNKLFEEIKTNFETRFDHKENQQPTNTSTAIGSYNGKITETEMGLEK